MEGDGLKIDDCTVNSKNGVNLTNSENVEITNSEISVSGYAVRAGAGSGGASGAIKLENNKLETDNTEGDAVIVLRGVASTQVDLDMTSSGCRCSRNFRKRRRKNISNSRIPIGRRFS